MSEGMNKVTLLGGVCSPPDLRFTAGGQAVLNVRLATGERYQDKDKQWQERTEYHSVVVWGKRGEALAKILAVGSQIAIEGSLRTTSYEKNNEKRYKTEVVANNVILCGRGGAAAESAEQPSAPSAPPAQKTGRKPSPPADDYGPGGAYNGDEIPFAPVGDV